MKLVVPLTTLPILLRAALSILQRVDFPAPLGPTMTTPIRCLNCSFSSSAFFSCTENGPKNVFPASLWRLPAPPEQQFKHHDLHTHTHLTRDEFQPRLLVNLFQGVHEYLVVHVGEVDPRENVFDQRVEARAVSERQLGHGVQSQGLHHQTALRNCMQMEENSGSMSICK